MSRYDVHTAEGEYQPGSNEQVLKNLLGITSPDEMNEVELGLLVQLYEAVLVEDLPDRALTAEDLKTWHRRWLGEPVHLGRTGTLRQHGKSWVYVCSSRSSSTPHGST
jgi:hypothetical protein